MCVGPPGTASVVGGDAVPMVRCVKQIAGLGVDRCADNYNPGSLKRVQLV